MNDPILGPLEADPQLSACRIATIPYQGRRIPLRVDPDDLDLERCLRVARELVTALGDLEARARSVAAARLLEEYNRSWREFSRTRADGSMEDVSDPVLSPSEFCARLRLESLAVTGSMVEFCFGDDGLFAGHSIFVTSFDGTAFMDTDAMLFG